MQVQRRPTRPSASIPLTLWTCVNCSPHPSSCRSRRGGSVPGDAPLDGERGSEGFESARDPVGAAAGSRPARERPRAKGRGHSHARPVIVTDVGVSAVPASETGHAVAATECTSTAPERVERPGRAVRAVPSIPGHWRTPGGDWNIPGIAVRNRPLRHPPPWPVSLPPKN